MIFSNFIGYDFLIFIAAGFNGFVYHTVNTSSEKLRSMMNHTVYVPNAELSRREVERDISSLRIESVIAAHNRMDKFYSLFVNMTGIFPLLGILGTVVSLLGLVSDAENVTGSFYGALTSTFWGLIFAIVFKFLDGVISPKIEYNERSVERYFEQRPTVPNDVPDTASFSLPEENLPPLNAELLLSDMKADEERERANDGGGIADFLRSKLIKKHNDEEK